MRRFALLALFLALGVCVFSYAGYLKHSTTRAERLHGIHFPHSSKNLENDSWGFFLNGHGPDAGFLTLCEISPMDMISFTQQLQIRVTVDPETNVGCPGKYGYNVWPRSPGEAVPGNMPAVGRRWDHSCVPLTALTGKWPTGDFM